jgi:hypothetical protein
MIYVIVQVSGEYSDYALKYATPSKEKAEEKCKALNEQIGKIDFIQRQLKREEQFFISTLGAPPKFPSKMPTVENPQDLVRVGDRWVHPLQAEYDQKSAERNAKIWLFSQNRTDELMKEHNFPQYWTDFDCYTTVYNLEEVEEL